jgi:hypothetical protein
MFDYKQLMLDNDILLCYYDKDFDGPMIFWSFLLWCICGVIDYR